LKYSPALEVALCCVELPSVQFSYVRPTPAVTWELTRVCVGVGSCVTLVRVEWVIARGSREQRDVWQPGGVSKGLGI